MKPLLKWVGGKQQLLDKLVPLVPKNYGTYFEPFFGGGALFFELKPEKAFINDKNESLMRFYQVVRDDAQVLYGHVTAMKKDYEGLSAEGKRDMYLRARGEYNKIITSGTPFDRYGNLFEAALLLFLNKTCFNGLYRVNKSGLFNVPWGQHKTFSTPSFDELMEASEALRNTVILSGDYADCLSLCEPGDFVFFDSPYYDTFDTYQKNGFTKDDHYGVFAEMQALSEGGVKCMLTNSDTDFMKSLYDSYLIDVVDVKRFVNRDGNGRTGREIIVRNYANDEELGDYKGEK